MFFEAMQLFKSVLVESVNPRCLPCNEMPGAIADEVVRVFPNRSL